MKKIVSVLSVAALALSSIFAAEVSIEYKTSGNLYKETNTKNYGTGVTSQTREALNQIGYKDAKSDIVISASSDFAGFVLDFDPKANEGKLGTAMSKDNFDQYYGWLNFGPLQITSGKWESRYGNELKDDKGAWADKDFSRYHVGVINGKYAHDIDNLSGVYTYTANTTGNTKLGTVGDADQKLSTALAFTSRPNDGTYIMLKGVLVDSEWGSTFRGDSDKSYAGYGANESDITFHSGFAGEFAFHVDNAIDVNAVVKSLKRDTLAFGAFVRPTIGGTTLLVGFSYGMDLTPKNRDNTTGKTSDDDIVDSRYSEMGIDLRLRSKLSDSSTVTTMHNVSIFMPEKAKDQKYNETVATMWNMISLAYKASDKVLLQFTAQNECILFNDEMDPEDANSTKMTGPLTNGGYNLSFMPAVVYSFNENASLSAGLKWDIKNVGALEKWTGTQTLTTSEFSIPVVFKVSL